MTIASIDFEGKGPAEVGTALTRASAGLNRCFEKLALRESPNLIEVIAWERLSDVLAPVIREDVRFVDHEPPHEN